ncbi:MAG TPA: hypothetical protein VNS22_01975 [Geminicoccus sp.]|uniref:hypothetical protein n=1 Tax=Geminicoccus sp. TaxID=2024832 RepID=UPI002C86C0C3|nr:hypothetical protein [Geminicoccus sp.]HWL67131.1 hypothetical protein [Geminicoccus sp.]
MLTERDVEHIAEKVVERETVEAFDRMGLLKDGRPDWNALAAPAKDRKWWQAFWDRVILAGIPIGLGLLVANFRAVADWITALLTIKGSGP